MPVCLPDRFLDGNECQVDASTVRSRRAAIGRPFHIQRRHAISQRGVGRASQGTQTGQWTACALPFELAVVLDLLWVMAVCHSH